MKNNLSSLFLPTLCAVAFIFGGIFTVAAQNGNRDAVLVASKPPLKQSDVDKVIEFYEWAFQTQFTSTERESYQTSMIDEFRQNAAAGRKNTDVLIQVLSKVKNMETSEQARVREQFNEGFAKDLQASNDETSQMILNIYKRGQNNTSGHGGIVEVLPSEEDLNEQPKTPRSTGGAGSSKLVGAWSRSDGTGGATDGTGKTRYNSGTDTTFEFFADGKMRITIKKEALSITQCQINETSNLPGTYSVSGNQLTMNLGVGSVVGTDSCKSSGNFKRSLTASTLTKTFVVKNLESVFRPDAPLILCLDNSSDDKCFERTSK